MAPPVGGKSGGTSGKGASRPERVPPGGRTPEKMSAYERWVLPNMETPHEREEFAISSAMKRKNIAAEAPPAVEETVAPLTAEDVEAIRQAAYDEGYQEGKDNGYQEGKTQGHKEGYDEGYKSGQDDVRAISLRLSQICRALLEPIPANDDALEETLKTLVTTICTQIVRRELVIDSDGVAGVVKEALECLQPGNKRIRIHLNPDDIDIVERELRNLNQWENQWRLLAHRTITRGGCIIDTDDSIVDARAEKRLSALLHQIYSKDASALNQETTPRDSLAQVFSEVPAFAGAENEESVSEASSEDEAVDQDISASSSEASAGETLSNRSDVNRVDSSNRASPSKASSQLGSENSSAASDAKPRAEDAPPIGNDESE